MNKSELIEAVAKESESSKSGARRSVDALLEIIVRRVAAGCQRRLNSDPPRRSKSDPPRPVFELGAGPVSGGLPPLGCDLAGAHLVA